MTDAPIVAAVHAARACPELLAALAELYAQLDAELATAAPQCRMCGKCCDFQAFGHRLYVSTAELALLTGQPTPAPSADDAPVCPYQQASQCAARAGRTLGCRAFFCEVDDSDLYERFHERIRALHDECGVPYVYVELGRAIASLSPSGKMA